MIELNEPMDKDKKVYLDVVEKQLNVKENPIQAKTYTYESQIDKKTCFVCKNKITDDKEYICTECYNKSLEKLKHDELYQKIKELEGEDWFCGVVMLFALFGMWGR